MKDLPAVYLPKLTYKTLADLRGACAKVDLIGQAIGMTNLAAKPLVLANLAEILTVMAGLIDVCERRALNYRRAHGLLTPEDLTADEAAANSPPAEPPIAEEG